MKIPAGPELDKEIATKFFKMVVIYDNNSGQHVVRNRDKRPAPIPQYSTNTDEAYKIIKALKSKGFEVKMGYTIENDEVEWYASLMSNVPLLTIDKCKSLAEAISCVALRYINTKPEDHHEEEETENLISLDFSKKNTEKDDDPS